MILGCTALLAQPAPQFEIASIKPTTSERQNRLNMDFCREGGSFRVAGTPVSWSLRYAYHLADYQLVGGPPWLEAFDSSYDIEARPPAPANNSQCRLMLQQLFADRFHLTLHRATKELPVYLLVIGKNGPKIHHGGGVKLNGSIQVDDKGHDDWEDGWDLPALAGHLSDFAGRPVLDRTGLDGKFAIDLSFSRSDNDDRPSIADAVQQQLGLRLESAREPIEVLIIDHIEKPAAN